MQAPGGTILGIILSSDKTILSVGTGHQSLHPLYLSIANIDAEVRCKQSYHSFVLIGLLPLPHFKFKKKNTELQTLLTARLHHYCLDFILRPLKEASRSGAFLHDPLGNIRRCHTPLAAYTVDLPEAQRIACVKQNASPVTTANRNNLGDDTPHPRRHGYITLDRIRKAVLNAGTRRSPWRDPLAFMRVCKKYETTGVHKPFWSDYPHANPTYFLTPDILHSIHREFYDHSFSWLKNALPQIIDIRYALFQPIVGREHFGEGVTRLKQVTGKTHRDLHRYHVPVTDGLSEPVQLCFSSLATFRLLAQIDVCSNDVIKKMENALGVFHTNKQSLIDEGYRVPAHFGGIPKLELMQNFAVSIPAVGAAIQYSTDFTEKLHPELKDAYRASSRKGYEEQICRTLDRSERIRAFDLSRALNKGTDTFGTVDLLETPKRSLTNYFNSRSTHTFFTATTAFHLNGRAEIRSIDEAAARYGISDDFVGALADFFNRSATSAPWFNERSGGRAIGGPRLHDNSATLYFTHIRLWNYVRVQTRSVQLHRKINPAIQVQASPPNDEWVYGRQDTCVMKNYDPERMVDGRVNIAKGADTLILE
jgi:hypothetical protein